MIDALKSILAAITTVFDFLGFLVTGLVQLFAMIPSAFTMINYSLGFLPTVLLAFASVAITISIVYLIIGR